MGLDHIDAAVSRAPSSVVISRGAAAAVDIVYVTSEWGRKAATRCMVFIKDTVRLRLDPLFRKRLLFSYSKISQKLLVVSQRGSLINHTACTSQAGQEQC